MPGWWPSIPPLCWSAVGQDSITKTEPTVIGAQRPTTRKRRQSGRQSEDEQTKLSDSIVCHCHGGLRAHREPAPISLLSRMWGLGRLPICLEEVYWSRTSTGGLFHPSSPLRVRRMSLRRQDDMHQSPRLAAVFVVKILPTPLLAYLQCRTMLFRSHAIVPPGRTSAAS